VRGTVKTAGGRRPPCPASTVRASSALVAAAMAAAVMALAEAERAAAAGAAAATTPTTAHALAVITHCSGAGKRRTSTAPHADPYHAAGYDPVSTPTTRN
jgi:hypothetical protein